MCAQEIIALFRFSGSTCPVCKRIISRYERTLRLSKEELRHLEKCVLS